VHSLDMQIGAGSLTPTLDLLNPKSVGCDRVEDYYCTVPSFKSFRSAVTPTYIHTGRTKKVSPKEFS